MRAALLPTPGDPLLMAYWQRNYERIWAAEVDIVETLTSRQDHGAALRALLESTRADVVMLCEDDAYVRHQGAVDAAFRRIESGECDVVGSPRGSASEELIRAAGERWPLLTAESGESGHALWPCFLFARRADLLATDCHFGARFWEAGESVAGLGMRTSMQGSADTLVSTSWQLRAAGLRIATIGQYRITNASQTTTWADPPWFHVGSLSSGYGVAFGQGASLPSAGDTAADEWERRASWWRRFWRTAPDHPEHERYGAALDAFIAEQGLSAAHIEEWERTYQPLVTWEEGG